MGFRHSAHPKSPDILGIFGFLGLKGTILRYRITGKLHLCALSQPIRRRIRSLAGECAAHADDARGTYSTIIQ